ncbi:MAG: ABC transporter ATP-binding protein [Pseudomonadota bacterium]
MTAMLALRAISKRFGKVEALKDVDLTVPRGAFVVLLGAAGAGKTTTLRIIAGLDEPNQGTVEIDGRDITRFAAKDRDVAMIFDNLALYPNKTGFQNIAHPLKLRRLTRAKIHDRVQAMSATLRIAHIMNRLPKTMSGGERQRVALGRALVRDPALFLLDEPLSSLDAMLRLELRAELKRLQRENGMSFLLATPDFDEALALADTIVMLVDGQVRQVAGPHEIYNAPADRDVARFVGAPAINLTAAEYDAGDRGRLRLFGAVFDAPETVRATFGRSQSFQAGLRPEDIAVAPADAGPAKGTISDIEKLGIRAALTIETATDAVRVTVPAVEGENHSVGDHVAVLPKLDRVHAFDADNGCRIG